MTTVKPEIKHAVSSPAISNCTLQDMENKLKIGSIILVHGWIMLKGLDGGCKYRVQSMPMNNGMPTYQFTKAKGKNVVCRFYTGTIDREINDRDLNRIEIVKL